jgi:hypothetical protein
MDRGGEAVDTFLQVSLIRGEGDPHLARPTRPECFTGSNGYTAFYDESPTQFVPVEAG